MFINFKHGKMNKICHNISWHDAINITIIIIFINYTIKYKNFWSIATILWFHLIKFKPYIIRIVYV